MELSSGNIGQFWIWLKTYEMFVDFIGNDGKTELPSYLKNIPQVLLRIDTPARIRRIVHEDGSGFVVDSAPAIGRMPVRRADSHVTKESSQSGRRREEWFNLSLHFRLFA